MKKLVLLCLVLLALATCLAGQETTASINGTITDASGAVVPNAQITVTNPSTGFSRDTVSGSAGDYNLAFLTPGTYEMKVQAKGFATRSAERDHSAGGPGHHLKSGSEGRRIHGSGRSFCCAADD